MARSGVYETRGSPFPLTPGLIYGLTPYQWHTLYLIADARAAETGI